MFIPEDMIKIVSSGKKEKTVLRVEEPIDIGADDAQSYYDIGVKYARGNGVKKDFVEAAKWFRKAAEHGVAFAQFYLGVMYATGRVSPRISMNLLNGV